MLGKMVAGAIVEGLALSSNMGGGFKPAWNKSDEKPRVWCDLCNKPRHTRETCWQIHGKRANWKSKSGRGRGAPTANEAETSPFTKEQMEHLQTLLKSTLQPSGISVASVAQTGNEKHALHSFLSKSTSWIIDSGASDHMTNSLHIFKSYKPCPGTNKVRIANGSLSPIAGKGSIKISEGIDLKFVLHVSQLHSNLLFVSKLSRDSNCCVIFYESRCIFQESELREDD